MKVLILLKFPYFGNGSGNYTRRLAENLSKLPNMEVAIAAPDKRPIAGAKVYTLRPPFRAIFEGHPEWKGAKKYADLTPAQFTRLYAAYLQQIVEIVEEYQPDVIHVNHAVYLTWIASHIKSFLGVAFVTTLHGTDIFLNSNDRRFKVLTGQALDRAETIIAVAPHTKKWFLKLFGRRFTRRMKTLPAGVQMENYQEERDTSSIDKKYNLAGKKVALFVGRLTREKGVRYLIKAAKHIKGEVLIVGEGPEKAFLERYAAKNNVNNVRFLGYFGKKYTAELLLLYARADVTVLPSIVDEALGLVVLEAMASRTPVVASNKGGIPLVVKDGKNGLLVRARSAQAIANAVNEILSNPARAKEMGIAARQTVAEKFDWAVLAPQIATIYTKAAASTVRMQQQLNRQMNRAEKENLKREREELEKKIEPIELAEKDILL